MSGLLALLLTLALGADMAWVPAGRAATRAAFPSAPSAELYVLSDGPRSEGALRVGDRTLQGAAAFREALPLAKTTEDQAFLSMLFLESDVAGRRPWTAPTGKTRQEPVAQPPMRDGDRLIYWRLHPQRADLERVTVSMGATSVLSVEDGSAILRAAGGRDTIEQALADLRDPDDIDACRAAIGRLQASQDPRGYPILIDQALHAPAPIVQEAAIEAVAGLPVPGRTEVLVQLLQSAPRAKTRYAAATQLLRLRDPAARPALEAAAARDADPQVRSMATAALAELPR